MKITSILYIRPVLLSPIVCSSDEVFVYEKPTPAGESKNNRFASAYIID